ncbi:hydrolase [Halovenus rubra]|uniref:Hydrolase n=2 Tax=Halovenus rubra TaxID=869890 RepID=A0ACC7E351_9EURY|nr:hydrolase [Halovenus rubra]
MVEEWQASAIGGGSSEEYPVTVPGKPEVLTGHDAVKYTTRFPDPRGPDDDVAVLELRGLYAHAEIEVTGVRVDGEGAVEHDTYFKPCRIAFAPHEDNELAVTCRQPADRFGGIYDTESVPERERVPGIWWGAELTGRPLPYIEEMRVRPEITEAGVHLHVQTTVVSDEPLSERVTYSLKPEGRSRQSGMMERARVETDAPGRNQVEHTIEVRDPDRWWPRELGEQNRYTLRATLGDSEYSVTTGICEISRDGQTLRVNGEPVSIRGVNLVGGTEDDIERARSLNATVIRAHAAVLPEVCYERCDKEGLLVWQDLPLTGSGTFDTGRAKKLARQLARQRAHNPSMAVYTVHDDPADPFGDGLGTGLFDRLRLRWRAWRSSYDHTAANAVADAFPANRPVVPVVGAPGIGADAGSYYPGWTYGKGSDIESVLSRYPTDIVAEFGAGSVVEGSQKAQSIAGFDAAKQPNDAKTPADSQTYQAELLQTVTEQLRITDVGALAFALRDTDDGGMGVYGIDGTAKPAVETLSNAFQPIQSFLADPSPGESEVVIINDLPTSFDVTLSWTAGDESGEFSQTVGEASRWRGGPVPTPQGETVKLVLSVGDHHIENQYDL